MGVVIGVDIGQRVDPTAIAVAEYEDRAPAPTPARIVVTGGRMVEHPAVYPKEEYHFLIRHLERLPLGTPYPRVAERLAEVVDGVRGRAGRRVVEVPVFEAGRILIARREMDARPDVTLFVDATGVGQPVVDLLDVAGVRPIPCYFTHGDRRAVDGGRVTIGKAWLVGRLQALLQTKRLHLPQTAEARQLARELLDYEIRVDEDANDKYGAFKVGTHDDLVTALGLAVLDDPIRERERQQLVRHDQGFR